MRIKVCIQTSDMFPSILYKGVPKTQKYVFLRTTTVSGDKSIRIWRQVKYY